MSRFIGLRVSYTCSDCGNLFTRNKKTLDENKDHGALCQKCSSKLKKIVMNSVEITDLVDLIIERQSKYIDEKETEVIKDNNETDFETMHRFL